MNKYYTFTSIIYIFLLLAGNNAHAKKFTLTLEKEAQSESYVVEISKTLDFKKIYQKKEFKTNKATLDLPVGVYFIRFYGVDENGDKTGYSPVRKVTLRYRANYTPIKQKDQHIAPKTFTLAFLEAENPKKQLYYSINNSKFKKYKGEAYSLDSGKKHSISYYFSDSKQVKTNKDSIKTLSLIVDDQAPTFSVTVGKKDFTKSDAINAPVDSVIKIKGQDKLSGLKEILYSYDNKKFFLYEYGIDVYDLEPFTIYFKLVDNVGNSTKIIKKKVLPVE